MRHLAVIGLVALMSGCVIPASRVPPVAPESVYKQIGATVRAPREAGWYLVQSNDYGVVFGRQYGKQHETAIANTAIFRVDGFERDKDFLEYIASKRERQDDKNRFKILSIENELVSYKGTACLKYRGLAEDHQSRGIESGDFQYLKTSGYVCRHPSNKAVAFQMEISHRGREKPFPDGLLSVGEGFFENIHWNDEGLKQHGP